MSKHWRPSYRTHWLSPEAYDALSPAEKRALWRRRQGHRTPQAYQQSSGIGWRPPRTRRRAGVEEWLGRALVVASLAAVAAWQLAPTGWSARPVPTASGASEVRASFHSCKWGGGTNCVVDGDTLYLEGQKIRIAGIDARETHDYGCESELELGERAAGRLQELVNSGAVSLSSIDRDEDVYGRKLRNVAVDGRDVGDVLVGESLARPYGSGRRPWC